MSEDLEYTVGDAVDAGPVPDGTWLDAEIVSISRVEKKTKEGEKYHRLKWKFTIVEDGSPWENKNYTGETSEVFEPLPDCKFYNWAQEALAMELPSGYRIRLSELEGKQVRVRMTTREYTKDDQQRFWTDVADVMRTRSSRPAPVSARSYADEEAPF